MKIMHILLLSIVLAVGSAALSNLIATATGTDAYPYQVGIFVLFTSFLASVLA